MPEGETRRLFFALWPDPVQRAALDACRGQLGSLSRRRVPAGNLHLTLLFLGDVPVDRVDAVRSAGPAGTPAFDLRLDRFGHFARAGVVWLGGEAPAAGEALVAVLGETVIARGLALDRRPWHPHVTLFRGVWRRPELPAPDPVPVWRARAYSLVESLPGRPYQVLRSWPLEST